MQIVIRDSKACRHFHRNAVKGEVNGTFSGCAIKHAPTLLDGKDEAFNPKECSLLRIFLFDITF